MRESPLLLELMQGGRKALDADLRELHSACGHPERYAEFVLMVAKGSIVNSGSEGHAADASTRAARDVGALLERWGRA